MHAPNPSRSKLLMTRNSIGQAMIESEIVLTVFLIIILGALKILIMQRNLIILDYAAYRGARSAIVNTNKPEINDIVQREIKKFTSGTLAGPQNNLEVNVSSENGQKLKTLSSINRGTPINIEIKYDGLISTQTLQAERDKDDWY